MRDGPRECQSGKDKKICISYSSLPRIGARPLICVPKAARTCWEESETKSSMLVIISLSNVSLSSSPQKPEKHERHLWSFMSKALQLTRDLSSYGGTNFCFGVLQKLHESRDQISDYCLFVHSFGNLARDVVSFSLSVAT